jgi:hypothetical protein
MEQQMDGIEAVNFWVGAQKFINREAEWTKSDPRLRGMQSGRVVPPGVILKKMTSPIQIQ